MFRNLVKVQAVRKDATKIAWTRCSGVGAGVGGVVGIGVGAYAVGNIQNDAKAFLKTMCLCRRAHTKVC